jgi:hypothetical protein
MITNTTRAVFSKELLQFLKKQGYTHILSVGDKPTEHGPDGHYDDYNLVPLKPGDLRLQFEETDHIIATVESEDVHTMANGVDAIRFLIEIPLIEYEQFLTLR